MKRQRVWKHSGKIHFVTFFLINEFFSASEQIQGNNASGKYLLPASFPSFPSLKNAVKLFYLFDKNKSDEIAWSPEGGETS